MNISYRHQRGAALIITLAVLVMALVLGVTSFQNSRLEESMAGNQRASAMALMAAEYGATEFWGAVSGDVIAAPSLESGDDYDSYYRKIVDELGAWVADGARPWHETCMTAGDGTDYSGCYTISLGDVVDNRLLEVYADGIVVSGSTDGISFSSGAVSTLPTNLVARRRLKTLWKVSLGESLSPLNLAGNVSYYNGLDSQAIISGEVIDGYVNPAISVKSRADAEEIVKNILKVDSLVDNDDVVFVPDSSGSDTEGVFHDSSVVDMVDGKPVYTGDYSRCDNQSSALCNYKGGIATSLGAPILSDDRVDDFATFVAAAVNPGGTSELGTYKAPLWLTEAQATSIDSDDSIDGDQDQVYFITNQDRSITDTNGNAAYAPPVWDDDKVRDYKLKGHDTGSEDARMEKPLIELGGFDKSGVLIIDGDVEFSGNPEFDGLIVVLGDYTIDGSGNLPFTGAIISAPYSVSYQYCVTNCDPDDPEPSTWIDVEPYRDDAGNLVVDADGTVVAGPDATVVSGPDGPLILDADGNVIGAVPQFVEVGADTGAKYTLSSGNSNIMRQFDPVGMSVNGGGKQPYNYDYQVLQDAIDMLSDEARLALLIGQRRLDGSYEYGLWSWSEVVAP